MIVIIIVIIIAKVIVGASESQVTYPPKIVCKTFSIKSRAAVSV